MEMSRRGLLASVFAMAVTPAITAPSPEVLRLRGDGVHDDGPALQRMIDRATANGGAVVHIPAGRYRVGAPLRITTSVVGGGATVITLKPTLPFDIAA